MRISEWDVIVVGGGIAGLSAALMLGRAGRQVIVIDGGEPRNRYSSQMHGVLGHEGVDPRQLIETGRKEAAGYGVAFLDGTVEGVEDQIRLLAVTTEGGDLQARALIAAGGVEDRLPPIPGLAECWGRSVLHCPYCHGWEVRGQRLAVIATSPLGVHQVQLVRQWSDQVVFYAAQAGPLAPETERQLAARQVQMVTSPVVEIVGRGDAVRQVRTGDGARIDTDAIFTMADAQPRDQYLASFDLDRCVSPRGSFLAVDATGRTSHSRIWAAGNITDPALNVPTAMSAGATVGSAVNMTLTFEEFEGAESGGARGAA